MDEPRSLYQRWRFALKPASWPKLFVPTFFGHALGAAHRGFLDLEAVALGAAWTFLLLVAIVTLNDVADRDVDALKRRIYPNASKKTIPDRVLPAHHLLFAGLGAMVLLFGYGFFLQDWSQRPAFGLITLAAFSIFGAYSLPPVRLNYRGGGELLEMVGVGIALPWLHAYLQGGLGAPSAAWIPKCAPLLLGTGLLALASAAASGLADEVSDRRGGKRTLTTTLGNAACRRLTEALVFAGAAALVLVGLLAEHVPLLATLPPAALIAYRARRMQAISTDAVTGAFDAMGRYKAELHAAIWKGTELLAALLILFRVFLRP
ncbi:MAG: prenyltransferase [Myxococcota bacterium]